MTNQQLEFIIAYKSFDHNTGGGNKPKNSTPTIQIKGGGSNNTKITSLKSRNNTNGDNIIHYKNNNNNNNNNALESINRITFEGGNVDV